MAAKTSGRNGINGSHLAQQSGVPDGAQPNDEDCVTPLGGAYLIRALHRDNREEAEVLAALTPPERVETIHRWIAFGALVDKRAGAVAEADYLGREADRILANFRTHLEGEVRRRFDPTLEGSLTRPIVDHVQDSNRALADARQEVANLMRVNFDENDARSVIAKIDGILGKLTKDLSTRFDPKRKDSVFGTFDDRIERLMTRMTAPDGPLRELATNVESMRMDMLRLEAERAGKQSVIDRTPLKGVPFEDELEARLASCVRPYRDVLVRSSKTKGPAGGFKGDFVVDLAEKAGRLVVEAKSGKIKSVPAICQEMDAARATRDADLVIVVARDVEDMPAQARPFQFYEEGIIVSLEQFEFAYRIARWIVAVQSEEAPTNLDVGAAREAAGEIRDALRALRAVRQQVGAIEKAAETISEHVRKMEARIVNAVDALDRALT